MLFAKNVARVAAFYEALANLHMTEAAPTWARLGGELNPPDQEWQLGTARICEGQRPGGQCVSGAGGGGLGYTRILRSAFR